jgi:hypothetical protein
MRNARPRCEECVRLEAEHEALKLEYLASKDELTITPKSDPANGKRSQHLDKVQGQLGESRKRATLHEETHQDEFH